MGRLRRHFEEEYGQDFNKDPHYSSAYRKVKRLKGFYSHLKVYVIVNLIIIISDLNIGAISDMKSGSIADWFQTSGLTEWHTYSTALFWGVVLLAHALAVFGEDIFFSNDWEQRKIKQYMDKEETSKNKWE